MKNQKKVVIYARTSQDNEKDDRKISIQEQIDSCQKLASQNNYEVIGIFKDPNMSGRTYPTGCPFIESDPIFMGYFREHIRTASRKSRKGLQQVMNLLPEIDMILVRDETRLMRPMLNSLLESYLWQQLQIFSVVLHSVEEGIIEPHNHDEQMISRIKATTKDKDVEMRRRQSQASLDKKRNNGDLYFNPNFYGFKSVGHQKVKPIHRELKIVKRIFEEFLAKKPLMRIIEDLNRDKIPTKSNNAVWMDHTVRRLLKRIQYCGYQISTTGEWVKSKVFYQYKQITREDFLKVQDILKERSFYPKVVDQNIHPMSGLLFCGYCSKRLYIMRTVSGGGKYSDTKNYRYYCKHGKLKRDPDCKKVMVREMSPSENPNNRHKPGGLWNFCSHFLQQSFIAHLKNQIPNSDLAERLKGKKLELKRIHDAEDVLFEDRKANRINLLQYERLMKKYSDEEDVFSADLKALEKQIDQASDFSPLFSEQPPSNKLELSTELYRELAHKVFKKLVIWDDRISVCLSDPKHSESFDVMFVLARGAKWLPRCNVQPIGNELDEGTKYLIEIFNKSCDEDIYEPMETLYDSEFFKVVSYGSSQKKTVHYKGQRVRPVHAEMLKAGKPIRSTLKKL